MKKEFYQNLGNFVPRVKFSHNWNGKLGVCDYFSTIRSWNEEKEKYYAELIGKKFEIELKGSLIGYGQLLSSRKTMLKDIPLELLILDTGAEDPLKLFEMNFGLKSESYVLLNLFKDLSEKKSS